MPQKEFFNILQAEYKKFENYLTKEQAFKFFKDVLAGISQAKQETSVAVKRLFDSFDNLKKKNEETLDRIEQKVEAKLATLKDGAKGEKGDDGKDGISPSVAEIATEAQKLTLEALKPQIPTIEQLKDELPRMKEEVRDALELLQGEEKLTAKAIEEKSLEEIIVELIKKNSVQRVGGGFSFIAMQQHLLDWTEATGTVNGVNTIFTIGHTPNPSSSLEVMVGNSMLFLTEDYTYSDNTITFLVAPPTGSKVRYKCLI